MSRYKFKEDVTVPINASIGFFSFVKNRIQHNLVFEGEDMGGYILAHGYKFNKEWLVPSEPGIETWRQIHYRLNETFKSDTFMNLDHIEELIKAGEKNQAKRVNLVVEAARKIFTSKIGDSRIKNPMHIGEIIEALEQLEEK